MNLHSITYYLFIISCIVIFSCDEVVSPTDCAGVVGGTATTDDCEQSTGGTTEKLSNYLKDCAGVCGGSAIEDECGVCDGNGITINICECEGNKYNLPLQTAL